tara:strand:- start:1861 stop:2418 length:558 start_codon:yes stop_codon:yes gene_type:complete
MAIDKDNNLIWIDLEMTGLDSNNVIIEIASIVTDSNLNELSKGPSIPIHRTEKELKNINPWSLDQHTKSGLLERVKKSKTNIKDAESETIKFLKDWVTPGMSPICGNSIATDRKFINKEMPELDKFMHYRMIDVSTVKELVKRWYPHLEIPEKTSSHLALDDIEDSIKELKWYKENVFLTGSLNA